jgi:hypothetical protein
MLLACLMIVGIVAALEAAPLNVSHFEHAGYVVVPDVFASSEIDFMRKSLMRHKDVLGLPSAAGLTIVDFLSQPKLKALHRLRSEPKVLNALRALFGGDNFRYCGHNDIGIDRVVGWHKDKLNDEFSVYQKLPLWLPGVGPRKGHLGSTSFRDEGHFIVKVGLYLQDHGQETDTHALKVQPGSHTMPQIRPNSANAIHLHPRKGSVVIFEQRITHRGQAEQTNDGRAMVSLGFGKRNTWTDEFEAGTLARQANVTACQSRVKLLLKRLPEGEAPPWRRWLCSYCGGPACKLAPR